MVLYFYALPLVMNPCTLVSYFSISILTYIYMYMSLEVEEHVLTLITDILLVTVPLSAISMQSICAKALASD